MSIKFHESWTKHPIFCTNSEFKVEKLFSIPVDFFSPLPFRDEDT